MAGAVKILVADRSLLVVEALEAMFSELTGGAPVLRAMTLQETIRVVSREQPDLVFIDAWIDVFDAEGTVRHVLECSPASSVFVMSTRCDPDFALRMRRVGAKGCFEKETLPSIAQSLVDHSRAKR
jgi:DNA-binding NarL/FixJ family response regulator